MCSNFSLTSYKLRSNFTHSNQDVQDELRKEIFEVIGNDKQPSLSERINMPYTEATILEIQRQAVIGKYYIWVNDQKYVMSLYAGPDGVMRVNKTPLNAGPYTIPSGHALLPSLSEIMMGEDSWTNAKKFDPTRFLEDGKFKRDERVIPFQIGKRVCPGEGLAKAELFLFLVGLIQKFKFEPETPGTIVDYTMIPGFTWVPHRHDRIKVSRIV